MPEQRPKRVGLFVTCLVDLIRPSIGFAAAKLAELRKSGAWAADFSLHAAADAINTGLLSAAEQNALYAREFGDRVNRVSLSPFNQYFVIQALGRLGKHDDALGSISAGTLNPYKARVLLMLALASNAKDLQRVFDMY